MPALSRGSSGTDDCVPVSYTHLDISPEAVKSYQKLSRLTEITDYIKKNYQKELSLESLAEIFGYSPTYLSKMFQKYAKINYRDYVQNVRLERASKELMETDHMISDIDVYKRQVRGSDRCCNK